MMAMRDWRARLCTCAFASLLLLADIGCGGYTLIDQTAMTGPAWVETEPPARDTHAATGDGRRLTPQADQAPATTGGPAATGVADPAPGSTSADDIAPVSEEPR